MNIALPSRFEPGMLLPALFLGMFGLVMVSSASLSGSSESPSSFAYPFRHALYLGLALVAFFTVASVPLETWRRYSRVAVGLALVLCVLVLIEGIGSTVNGARRWIALGPISLQPIEPVKFLVLVYLAATLAKEAGPTGLPIKAYIAPLLLVGAVSVLLYLQPDFGSIVLLWLVVIAVTFLAGMRMSHLFLAGTAVAGGLGYLALTASYRLERLTTFLDPWQFATTQGYQSVQAQIAFGRGEVFGLGLGDGVQKLFYLPEAHNDFILAVIAEELGFVGSLAVVLLFAWLIGHVLRVGKRAWTDEDCFPALLAWGVGIAIGLQALINFGVNLGVLPTKGLTLPLVSYGGNSLLVTAAMLGLVARVESETGAREDDR